MIEKVGTDDGYYPKLIYIRYYIYRVSHNYLPKIIQGDGKRKINRIFSINICPKQRNKKVTALRRGYPEDGFFKKSSKYASVADSFFQGSLTQ